MKLSPRDAIGYFAKPDPKKAGLLLYGPDAMRIALRRQEVIEALIGPQGDEEMRLTRMSGAEMRKDKAMLMDAMKAQGFFPGPRVAFVEDATDQVADAMKEALFDWREGDAQVIVTAGSLKATSKLRKLFESHPSAYCVAIYADPPSRAEIEATLKKAGVQDISREAMVDIEALSRSIDPGDFRQTLEKLSLYKLSDPSPVSSEDVQNCAPATSEAEVDDVLNIVAEGRTSELGPLMIKIEGQGIDPVALSIFTMRHFRALHAAASDPGGAASGIARARPPIFGPRRDRMTRQAQGWGVYKLETALGILTDTDLTLRSSSRAPTMAVMERALIRLAMLAQRR
ncbi:MAG: DNA polymerase III subunit delta [Alphaproteobacteria bacterium]|nr:DNA polymerase III subunit delta [Alphaproteobacteria bacterium]MBU1277715.1 DNA polymerase III subunit delta [Alphaproteobacteria bacterium]MBU1574272.1 DNA polymerase III subunit delta [Alphaproteobacteria bacterium]MBU1829308.1 DNA polymerase III subunit delta [Alphaproteobacteria bacterium]MBU2077119.1 DNA polymerase III subunit delta [Alphaproteobacteria bacterium]